jgi:DtxR family Mn-dependent transcriptional regulator
MPDPLFSLLIAAVAFLLVLTLFHPQRGLIPRWRRVQRLGERVQVEDALKHLQRCETHHRHASLESLAGALDVSLNQAAHIMNKLEARVMAQVHSDEYKLTPAGRDYALRVIRAHRLWEHYLAEETGFSESEWHDQAERYEHVLTPDQADALSWQLGNPSHDPHGDPIPTANGSLQHHGGAPLTAMAVDVPLRIVHIEDEPEAVYAQILAEDLHPGMQLRLTELSPQRVRFWAGGDEHLLAPIVAANISVLLLPEVETDKSPSGPRLSSLKPGEQGRVVGISPASRGPERRRLMDLGIVPGTTIEVEYNSPSGDPTAYRVRGALIALRREQADQINISPIEDMTA